jgi:hypothetical protein
MAIRSSSVHSHHRSSRSAFPGPPRPAIYKKIAYSFFGLTVLIVIGALWVSSVRARVIVKTKGDHQASIQTMVELAKSPEQGQLRGRVVKGTFDRIQEFAVKDTGSSEVAADTEVTGTVKVINNYSRSQTLVKNTRLLTADNRLYRIDKTIVIEPKQSVNVTAHSDQKGKQYILSVGTKLTIPGLWIDLQKFIYAETVSGFSGGEQVTKVVSSMDVDEAQKVLEDAVFEQATKTLTAEANVGEDWKGIFTKKILEKKTNVKAGESSEQFLASIKMEVVGVFYPAKDMETLVKQKLLDTLRDGRELSNFDASLVTYKVEQADADLEKAKVSVSAQANSRLTENSTALSKDAIAGLPVEEAKSKIKGIEGVEDVTIQIRPIWIKKLPTLKDHIEIIIQ